jgi:hypothetical protein
MALLVEMGNLMHYSGIQSTAMKKAKVELKKTKINQSTMF